MRAELKSAVRALTDVFFARSCVHCGEAVDGTTYEFLCEPCSKHLFLAKPPNCKVCGYPFFGAIAGPKTCPHCAELNPIFDNGKTLFLAKGPARSIIHELKYKSGFYMLRDIGRIISESPDYQKYIDNASLVPVPLHKTKKRERGYNQSEKIAEMMSVITDGRSKVEKLLIRRQYTQTQTRLNRDQRHQNVKNAFALAADAVVIPNRTYILIDDVFTTGSTLNACAHVLQKAGATRLKVATLGHG